MKLVRTLIATALIVAGFGALIFTAQDANAVNVWGACDGSSNTAVCGAKGDSAPALIKNVINTILVVLGMIAVIMIIIGGIRYTTSNGDSGSTKSAKDTILYAVIGLVIAILAFAIVNFVVGAFSTGSGSGGGTTNNPATPAPAQPGGGTTIQPGSTAQ